MLLITLIIIAAIGGYVFIGGVLGEISIPVLKRTGWAISKDDEEGLRECMYFLWPGIPLMLLLVSFWKFCFQKGKSLGQKMEGRNQ